MTIIFVAGDPGLDPKYLIDGMLHGPAKAARVRTIWFTEPRSSSPRLVTVYPTK